MDVATRMPWRAQKSVHRYGTFLILDQLDGVVAYVRGDVKNAPAARLIAAAPDLYDALSRIIEEYGDHYLYKGSVGPYQQARAALAKALGDS